MIDLINRHAIGSQEELAEMLRKKGYDVTQATLSRDLKMLKTTKVPTDRGSYMYVMPGQNSFKEKLVAKAPKAGQGVGAGQITSLTFSGNMTVIKTISGYAQAIATIIDSMNRKEVLGTVAGTDTVFVVMEETVTRPHAIRLFSDLFLLDREGKK